MNWFTFTLAALSTFRLSVLIAEDSGPANAIKKTRQSVPKRSSFWKGIRCLRCTSVWSAMAVTFALWWLWLVPTELTPLYCLALSGAAIALNRITE